MRTKSLQYTLISRLLMGVFCVIAAGSLITAIRTDHMVERALREELIQATERTAILLSTPVWDLNESYTTAILNSIFHMQAAVYAEVSTNDTLLASQTGASHPGLNRALVTQGNDYLWELRKIIYKDTPIGYVLIAFSRDSVARSILNDCLSFALLFVTIALTITALTIGLTRRHIFTPLAALEEAAAALSKGDLDIPFPPIEDNEVGTLAHALAAMAQGLKAVTASRDDLNREIAGRKHSEEQLRILVQTIEESPFAVIVTDPEGCIEYVNKQFVLNTGWPLVEAVGSLAPVFKGEGTPPDLLRNLCRTARHCAPWRGEILNKRKNGEEYWESVSISPLADASGTVTHLVCVGEDITERRRVERALHDSQERLQLAVEGGGLGMWDWNVQTDQLVFSDHWMRMLGYEPHELTASLDTWRSLLHPDDADQALEDVTRHHQGLSPIYSSEYRLKAKNGQWRWMLAQGKVMTRSDDGKPQRMSGTLLDITNRKNAEFALQHKIGLEGLASSISSSFLNVAQGNLDRTILAALGLIGTFTDADRCFILQFDDPPSVLHEWASLDCPSLRGHLLLHPLPPYWLQALRLQTFISVSLETATAKGGAEEQAFLHDTGIRSIILVPLIRRGETIGCIGIDSLHNAMPYSQDVVWLLETLGNAFSQTLEAFDTRVQLEESEERFRYLVESMSEGLGIIDTSGVLTYANHQLCRMLGRTREDILGRTWPAFLDEKNTALYQREIARRAKGVTDTYELVWTKPSGEKVFCLVSPTPLFDETGTFTGSFGVYTDLTKLKLLESQLLQSQKLESIGQLAAGIAHEINTPAQYVDNNIRYLMQSCDTILSLLEQSMELAQLATAGKPTGRLGATLHRAMVEADLEMMKQELPAAFADCLDGLGRIAEIVHSVKQFSHPGIADKEMADINQAIRSTIMVSVNEWKYDASVDTVLDPSLPLVPCYTSEFNQVILNLIINATHAIKDKEHRPGEKGQITITTSHDDAWVEVRVADNGGGIPKEIQDKVFNPFFTTKPVGKGTGQGLAISHTVIVEKHGGSISFESKDGEGTTFIVRLPIHDGMEREALS
ncbi:MAG: PAS domain S-box protein [Desulfovibrionaceae bacterium]